MYVFTVPHCGYNSRLLYYHIREIKTWLNINHVTVHILYILKLKEHLTY